MKPILVFYHLFSCFMLLCSIAVQANQPACYQLPGKIVIGALEQVHLTPPDITMVARIDSGAHTSSLDARDIVVFQRDGLDWVRFVVIDRETQKTHSLERPLIRWAQIKQASSNQVQTRAVIDLEIRLAGKKQTVEFNLINRSHLAHPILVGRNVLQHGYLIDVSQKLTMPLQIAD